MTGLSSVEPPCPPAQTHLLGKLHGLQGQLSGGRKDEGTGPSLGAVGLEPLEHGEEEAGSLAAARPGHGHHVLAVQDHRDGLQGSERGRGGVSSCTHGPRDPECQVPAENLGISAEGAGPVSQP